jgi:hypothetical protein
MIYNGIMSKITCYVTEHYTVEFDSSDVKMLYGKVTQETIKDYAFESVIDNAPYDTTVVIEEIEKDVPVKNAKRGRGSY